MTSQTPLVTQPASKCLVIGLRSPTFTGGVFVSALPLPVLLRAVRKRRDALMTGWWRATISFEQGQDCRLWAANAERRCDSVENLWLWARQGVCEPRAKLSDSVRRRSSAQADANDSLVEGNETTQVEVLLCCRWEFTTPAALLHFLLICEVMRHEIYSPAVKMIFFPLVHKRLFWSHGTSQESKCLAVIILKHGTQWTFFFFSFYWKVKEKVEPSEYVLYKMFSSNLDWLLTWKCADRNRPACYCIISLRLFACMWLYFIQKTLQPCFW